MSLSILECQVSKMVNSDTRPRPTTGGARAVVPRPRGHAAGPRVAGQPRRERRRQAPVPAGLALDGRRP
jgi:hypothetical protein